MKMKNIITLIAVVISLISCGNEKVEKPMQKIKVVKVESKDIKINRKYVGEISGKRDIPIRARVDGFLEKINFKEGGKVKKGSLLYVIDAQSYMAQVAVSQSKVAEAKTTLVRAKNDYDRIKPLADKQALSKSDLDASFAEYEAAKAYVSAAESDLKIAEINLGYTKIKAPITGVIGKTQAKVGEYVGKDPNPIILNTVSQVDEVLIDVFIPEAQYIKLERKINQEQKDQNMSESLATKDILNKFLSIKLELSDGSIFKENGLIKFIDRNVNANTGTILMQLSFNNSNKLLRPGMFGKVILILVQENAIVIPQRTVMDVQGSSNVYVVDKDGIISIRNIQVTTLEDGYMLVNSGLKIDETIVFEGLQAVRPKMKIITDVVKYEPKKVSTTKE